ncbi:tryptophan synthase beta chain 1-like [Iris pallida]|uniref:Tryptophan synthase beta chain 1-like n=1 Tax=Iris pallida TaxID=29817 RepID=A0AAX6EDV9_IRIPA|nr:tryptophan synthase beta chain 1-like [Iris pallida]
MRRLHGHERYGEAWRRSSDDASYGSRGQGSSLRRCAIDGCSIRGDVRRSDESRIDVPHRGFCRRPISVSDDVREFQFVIGRERRRQAMEKWGGKPDVLVACVSRDSNTIGLFHEFFGDADVRMVGIEATGRVWTAAGTPRA